MFFFVTPKAYLVTSCGGPDPQVGNHCNIP